MIKAVIFDMFETLVTLFEGKVYFGENIAADVGDGGSKELYAAREAGMHPLQCTWFYDMAFEPHIPCPILDEFDHAGHQSDVLSFI